MPQCYLRSGASKIRCIVDGSGPVLLLLHPSPLTADIFANHIEIARDRFTVVAMDLPGLGFSDRLDKSEPDCADYARHIVHILRENGIQRATIWALATGAYIAQEIARQFPEFAEHTILESFTASRPEEKSGIFDSYFCDVSPRWDGSHLATLFQFNRDVSLFYPWFERTERARTHLDIAPPEAVHQLCCMHAFALESWDTAYRAAFRYSSPDSLVGITTPVTVVRSQASILKHHVDRLQGFGDNVDILRLGADRLANIETVTAMAAGRAAAGGWPRRPQSTDQGSGFLSTGSGAELHVVVEEPDEISIGPPVVLLHDLPGDHTVMQSLLTGGAAQRFVIPDLPGYGGSTAPTEDDWFAAARTALHDLLDDLAEPVSLVSFGASAALAIDMLERVPDRIAACHLVRPDLLGEESVRWHYPSMAPSAYGEHLHRSWGFLRDRLLYSRPDLPSAATRIQRLAELDLPVLHREHTAWMMRGDALQDDLRSLAARAKAFDLRDNRLHLHDSPGAERLLDDRRPPVEWHDLPVNRRDWLAAILGTGNGVADRGRAESTTREPMRP